MSFASPPAHLRRPAVPLAPLLDVLFLLLIFFATTSTYRAVEQQIDIDLPISQTAGADQPAGNDILINLERDGRIVVNGRTMSLDELYSMLADLAADYPDDRVIIRGDQAVPYGRVIAVMDATRAAAFTRIHFATVQGAAERGE